MYALHNRELSPSAHVPRLRRAAEYGPPLNLRWGDAPCLRPPIVWISDIHLSVFRTACNPSSTPLLCCCATGENTITLHRSSVMVYSTLAQSSSSNRV